MSKDFLNGYNYILNNLSASFGSEISEQWLAEIETQVDTLKSEMYETAIRKGNMDIKNLQGFIAEVWGKGTFNIKSAINNSSNYAEAPDVNYFASPDVIIKNKTGKTIKEYSFKYYSDGKSSINAQAETPYQRYKRNKSDETYEKFLSDRDLSQDGNDRMSIYQGQGKIIPYEQINDAKKYLLKKINNSELSKVEIKRYKEVYDTLDSVIKDNRGNSSIQLSYEDAKRLARAAKEGNISDELLKECGLDINEMIGTREILSEAFRAGITSAMISYLMSVGQALITSIINEKRIDVELLKEKGIDALPIAAKSFLSGGITSGIVIAAKTGKLGEELIHKIDGGMVANLVALSINTIDVSIKYSQGKISKEEVGQQIMQMCIISISSRAVGMAFKNLLGFPYAYMLGSLIGSVIGGFIYHKTNKLIVSICASSDFTFFGIVNQNYKLPDDILDKLNIKEFDFNKIIPKGISYERYETNNFSIDDYKFEKIGIKVLNRDLIEVHTIGYK